jgi:hypothetical protein
MNTTLYIAAENADMTEGRGPMIVKGLYPTEAQALAKVKGRGVMGYGDGEVYKIELIDGVHEGGLLEQGNLVYGYRKTPDGTWGYGFTDLRDYNEDPEFAEYKRLRDKFRNA